MLRRKSLTTAATFKSLDAYAKPIEELTVRTASGASVTLVSVAVIIFLIMTELVDWQTSTMNPSLLVDSDRMGKMKINLDITFPKIPCMLLSMDVMDVAGEFQTDVHHTVFKSRLSADGKVINLSKTEVGVFANGTHFAPLPDNYCGDCYGGKLPASGCCNTCESVEQAYSDNSWTLMNYSNIAQCIREDHDAQMLAQKGEGCTIHGFVQVNKVAGNFHFAPGKGFQNGGMHLHELSGFKASGVNFEHRINTLSFGEGDFKNPLDGVKKDHLAQYYTSQYYIKVVGTNFIYLNGTTTSTNQFSVTEHEKDITPKQEFMGPESMPGVFFSFDISPMIVIYTQSKKAFAHFLTDVCSIVGGVFTVAGIIDSFIWTAEKSLKRKNEIGKSH